MTKSSETYSFKRVETIFSFTSFQILLLVLTGIVALLFVAQAIRFLPVTADNIYPEAAGVLSAQRWAQGHPLYQDYRDPPYLITPFPPVWYGLLALGTKIGFTSLDSLTLFGRILSLAALAGMLGVGYLWNRRLGLSPPISFLTVTFYLSLPILIPWAVAARPDFLALCAGFLALYWAGFRSTSRSVAVAAALAAIAFLIRHNAVAVPVAAVLWLAWSKRWKHAGLFCTVWGAVVGVTVLVFQIATHGLLLLNLSGATFGQFALTYVRDIAGRLVLPPGHGFVIALFAFGLLGFLETWKDGDASLRLLGVYLVVSCGLVVVGSAARGAAVNHYLEPALAMAVLVPTGVARLRGSWQNGSAQALFAIVIVAVLLLPSVDMQRSYFVHNKPENLQSLARLVEKRRVFTDVPYLAARTSTLELMEPASLMNTERAAARVAWSSAIVERNLQEKKYELVVLGFPLDSPYNPDERYPRYGHLDSKVRTAIANNYRLCAQLETSDVEGASEIRYVYAPLADDVNSNDVGCPVLGTPPPTSRAAKTLSVNR